MTKYRTLIDRWHKEEGKFAAFRELLESPLMQEALEIVRARTQPDLDTCKFASQQRSATDAAFIHSQINALFVGTLRALETLQSLAEPPPAQNGPGLQDEPFADVNEDYFNRR